MALSSLSQISTGDNNRPLPCTCPKGTPSSPWVNNFNSSRSLSCDTKGRVWEAGLNSLVIRMTQVAPAFPSPFTARGPFWSKPSTPISQLKGWCLQPPARVALLPAELLCADVTHGRHGFCYHLSQRHDFSPLWLESYMEHCIFLHQHVQCMSPAQDHSIRTQKDSQ